MKVAVALLFWLGSSSGLVPLQRRRSIPLTRLNAASSADFSGEWEMDLKSSDPLGPVLRELGLNRLLAAVVSRLGVRQSIVMGSDAGDAGPDVVISVKTALGTDELDLRADGTATMLPGLTGSSCPAVSQWLDGRLETRQSLGDTAPVDPEADLFVTIRSLEDGGSSLCESVSIVRRGQPVAGVNARRILRRVAAIS